MKRILSFCALAVILLFAFYAMAADKVVVIPLNSANELLKKWTAVNFITTGINIANSCSGGTEYVKQSDFSPYLYVGAMLCSPSRYKLFLAFSPGGPYYEIGDTSGSGQDHCELIGGTNGTVGDNAGTSSGERGFWRSSLGQDFFFEDIPASNAYRAGWYECGINIP